MAEEIAPPAAVEETVIVRRRPLWARIAKWIGIALIVLALLIGGGAWFLDTQAGHNLIGRQIAAFRLQSGLNFRIGRIEGSIYGRMILRDVAVHDARGPFATAREIVLDWRPFQYISNRIDIRSATSPEIRISRMPALEPVPADPNAPILPDIDIDVARLEVARIDFAQGITGRRHIGRLTGSAHLADGRAQIVADGGTIAAPGVAGGDKLAVKLDAVPDKDRLDIDLKLDAPAGGLVAGLAGVEAPLRLDVAGAGAWSRWNGRATGYLGGSELANLAILAENGRLRINGPTHPGLYIKGPVERLAEPALDVALDATLKDRAADTHLVLRSNAIELESRGLIDLGRSRFGNFRTEAVLRSPGAIAPNLRGSGIQVAVALDGPFRQPVADYKIRAASIGFGTTTVERLFAEGRSRVDANRILIPVRATATRVTGLNDAAGGLLENVALSGDLALSGDQLLSDNLRLRSKRIDATAIVIADLGDGTYNGALKGRVNDYQIAGVAMINLTADAKLVPARGGGWGIQGKAAAVSTKIFSEGLRSFLGGNASANARVSLGADGVVSFGGLRMDAPLLHITDGSGRYGPNGALVVNANGRSSRYGPVSAQVTGTVAAPQVLVRAARPGLGVGLADLEARIKGQGTSYAIVAKGGTDYGPFTADVLLQAGKTMVVDVRTARFAGMDINGRIEQLAAGPFGGRLEFAGSGVNGNVRLGAEGKIQRADIDARALNAAIPGAAGLTIGRAIVNGHILFTDTPQIVGDAQIAGLRNGTGTGALTLKAARVKIDYQGGSGTAQLYADGSTAMPFRIAANAKLSPSEWLVAVKGVGGRIGFSTERPARVAITDGTYRLLPTRIDFDQGTALLAGTYGKGMSLQARLEKVDLQAVNAFVPGLGVGGSATGALDFSQAGPGAFPRAEARLEIANFTRSSLATVSTPVNVSFVGKLLPDGGDARALIKRGTATIGRVVATLRPLGPEAGSWTERLNAAPLSGGVRYNGPAAVLFSLAGMADQQLTGAIGLAADFSGRVGAPDFTGIVRGNNLVYENETYGTRLSNLKIDGRFNDDQLVLNQLSATAGSGTLTANGSIGLSAEQGFPMKLEARLDNARLARSDALAATATGTITLTRNASERTIVGDLRIPEARYEIVRQGAAEVAELTGVRRKGTPIMTAEQRRAAAAAAGHFDLRLTLRAPNQLFVSGMGLESEWGATVNIRGTTARPLVTGTANIVRGTYDFAGKRFDISHGEIDFQGSELTNPTINIAATTTAEGITAILNVTGTGQRPRIAFTSTPALSQEEVLSRILFGSSVTDLNATEAIQLAASLNTLRGGGGGLNPLGKLRSATGIDRLRIVGADEATGRGTALSAGKYITKNIYVEIITDARGFTATQLEVALSRALSVLSQTGSFGGSSVSIRYSKDY